MKRLRQKTDQEGNRYIIVKNGLDLHSAEHYVTLRKKTIESSSAVANS